MTEAYGRQFTAQFGTEPLHAWAAALEQFSDEELVRGYMACLADNREFCPNLSKIIGYCSGRETGEFGHMAHERICHKPWNPAAPIVDRGVGRALPPPTDSRSVDQIRAELRSLFK